MLFVDLSGPSISSEVHRKDVNVLIIRYFWKCLTSDHVLVESIITLQVTKENCRNWLLCSTAQLPSVHTVKLFKMILLFWTSKKVAVFSRNVPVSFILNDAIITFKRGISLWKVKVELHKAVCLTYHSYYCICMFFEEPNKYIHIKLEKWLLPVNKIYKKLIYICFFFFISTCLR